MNRGKIAVLAIVAAAIAIAAIWTRGGERAQPAGAHTGQRAAVTVPAVFSDTARIGERAFNAVCAACHGVNAAGTDAGPPLVHRVYEPSHHGDYAFESAVANGVRAHHWRFGDMPPQPALTKADLRSVIAYVRELQRENGIE